MYKHILFQYIVDRLPNNKLGYMIGNFYANYYKIL